MRDVIAEFIGTFGLVFAITSTIAGTMSLTGSFTVLNLVAIAFAAGLVLCALILAFGSVSGAHFNPAVTIGLVAARKFRARKAVPYLIAQFAGGILASLALWVIAGNANLGATTPGAFGTTSAVLMEVAATALFLIVILSVTSKKAAAPQHAGIAIGFYLLAAHLYAIPFSGASLNPARSLGPALLTGGAALSQVWVYFVGPIVGGVLGALAYKVLHGDK